MSKTTEEKANDELAELFEHLYDAQLHYVLDNSAFSLEKYPERFRPYIQLHQKGEGSLSVGLKYLADSKFIQFIAG